MALPTLDATFASAADLPRKQMLAKWLVEELGSGSIADYYDLPERYLWAKIAVAAGGPREEAAYISTPKNYAWSDIYNAVSGDIANSTVVVSGAGSDEANGIYTYRGQYNGYPYYNLEGKPNNPLFFSIYNNATVWRITTYVEDSFYEGNSANFPWQSNNWYIGDVGVNPAPSLIQQTPNYTDWSENVALGHIAAAYRGDTGNPANLATYIDWPWRYKVASIITAL